MQRPSPRVIAICLFILSMSQPWGTPVEGASLPEFQEVLQDVIPAVGHIRSVSRPQRPSQVMDPYQYFFQLPVPQNFESFPLGTGFLIANGKHCITSYRNIEGVEGLEILMPNKKILKLRLIGADRGSDLALLQVETSGSYPSLEFADSRRAQIGDKIFIVGQPLGFQALVSQGSIAAKGSVLGRGSLDKLMMLDVSTNPANAGGPIVDRRGRVLGMSHYATQAPLAYGFGLPSAHLEQLIRGLLKHGKVLRSWLGLVPRNLAPTNAVGRGKETDLNQGIQIENLIVDGPAARAGLHIGDLLVAANKTPLASITDLQHLLEQTKSGTLLTFRVFRRQKSFFEVSVTLGEIPSAEDLPDTQDLL